MLPIDMKTMLLLLGVMVWSQVAVAAEAKFIDDAPKGIIHVTTGSGGAEVHHYLRTSAVIEIQQFAEEDEGKVKHYVRIHTVATAIVLEFAQKKDADEVRERLVGLVGMLG